MNKKGFTLVELLSVIVILAVILVIAIPQIINVIKQSRISTFKDSAILIATNAEKDYLSNQVLDSDYDVASIPCEDVAKLNEDYESCKITYKNRVATILLEGKAGGKFDNLVCMGTKDEMYCGSWKVCVDEHSTCDFSGGMYVRYGARNTWKYGYYTNSVKCENSVFGDPTPNVYKKCYIIQ